MVDEIAGCAERIRILLAAEGEIDILRLPERLEENEVVAYQALGWICYEGAVRYGKRGRRTVVSLMPAVRQSAAR